jgi:hypothetical protein
MGKNLERLRELKLIDEDALTREHEIVIELLSEEELAVLKGMKRLFDVEAAVGGTAGKPLPIVI